VQKVWRFVAGHLGYRVSNMGEIKGPKGLRALQPNAKGYLRCNTRNGAIRVHTAVLTAFCGPRPKKHVARHLDGDLQNNRLSNLQRATPKCNSADRYVHGTMVLGSKSPNAKLDEQKVMEILSDVHTSDKEFAAIFGVSLGTISNVRSGRSWRHV
jgi:hypothetical protein